MWCLSFGSKARFHRPASISLLPSACFYEPASISKTSRFYLDDKNQAACIGEKRVASAKSPEYTRACSL
jgi:hypothetical protein